MITEEFCPGLAPSEVNESTHNPSAVCLLADSGPDAHPLSCHVVYRGFLLMMPDWFGVHKLIARKALTHILF